MDYSTTLASFYVPEHVHGLPPAYILREDAYAALYGWRTLECVDLEFDLESTLLSIRSRGGIEFFKC